MKEILKLKNPVMVNGTERKELSYDSNEITAVLFSEADSRRKQAAGAKVAITPAAEFDYAMHLYLGFAAVIAVNPEVDFADLEKIKGADVIDLMGIGRNFILKSEDSVQNSSDEQSETTAVPTTQAPQTSSESE